MMNLYDQSISILEYAIYNIYSIFIDQNIFSYIYICMEQNSLLGCLDGEMVDTRDSKSRAKERGGSSPLQGIILLMLIE